MIDAFGFAHPDKIPVFYHPSLAGLHVHGQKLIDLFNEFPPDNPITFDSLPSLPPETINEKGRYREIKTDEWDTEWEYLVYGIHGHPRSYPFPDWQAASDYTFPPFSYDKINSPFSFNRTEIELHKKNFLIFDGWVSIFEKLCALRPMDDVLVDLYSEDEGLIVFLDRLTDYWLEAIDAMIDADVDVFMFGDDWGTQISTVISPAMFKDIFIPRYERLIRPIKKAGKRVFFHSCGFLGDIFNQLADLGIDGLWPQIRLFEESPNFQQICREKQITLYIHPDRQRLIPRGTPTEIETAIKEYADHYHHIGGGAIFYVEIENDAPFENVEALIKSIHRYR
jgi:uroporphyrinogen decarboxylase